LDCLGEPLSGGETGSDWGLEKLGFRGEESGVTEHVQVALLSGLLSVCGKVYITSLLYSCCRALRGPEEASASLFAVALENPPRARFLMVCFIVWPPTVLLSAGSPRAR